MKGRWAVCAGVIGLLGCGPSTYTIGAGGERTAGTRFDGAYSSGGMDEARAQRERRAEAARYTGGGTSNSVSRPSECGSGGSPDATRSIALVFAGLSDFISGPTPDATVVQRATARGSTSSVYLHDSRSSVERLEDSWNERDGSVQASRARCERDVAARDVQRTLAAADALQSKLQCVVTASVDLRAPGDTVADAVARGQLLLSQWALERARLDAAGQEMSIAPSSSGPRSASVVQDRLRQALMGLRALARGAALQFGAAIDARRAALRGGAPAPSVLAAYRSLSLCVSNRPPPREADRRVVARHIARLRERAAGCGTASHSVSIVVDGVSGVPTQIRGEHGPVSDCVRDAIQSMQLPPVDRESWTLEFPLDTSSETL
jgi:hypothetical protein